MINFRDAVFAENGTTIDCEIEQNGQWLALSLNPSIAGITAVYAELHAGMALVAGPYVAPVVDQVVVVRAQRDALLVSTVDSAVPNVMVWNAMSVAEQDALTVYRQELLDVPEQAGFPDTIIWPTNGE
jgi:hypothetical protein